MDEISFSLGALATRILRHPANRDRRALSLLSGFVWQFWKRSVRRPAFVSYHGHRLFAHPASHQASAAIYFSGLPDFWEMSFVRDYLRPGDLFVDVGSNIGLYSLLASALVGPNGAVHAFEPGDFPRECLERSIERSGIANIIVHAEAAGESAHAAVLQGTDATASVAGISEDGRGVPVVRLDEMLPDACYAMAKFDIEGYEPFALRGMRGMLERGNPAVLLVEVAGYSKRYGMTSDALLGEIRERGYSTFSYEPAERKVVATERPWEQHLQNVLCIFDSKRSEVERRISRLPSASVRSRAEATEPVE